MNGTFARDALRYHHAGLNVLPVVIGSKHPPAGLTWRRWQVLHQTEAEVGQLIEAHPSADVALMTGGPGNLWTWRRTREPEKARSGSSGYRSR